eukprot:COSAG01_NODE_65770_length_272_cov_0.722543_1_plen_78_part_10
MARRYANRIPFMAQRDSPAKSCRDARLYSNTKLRAITALDLRRMGRAANMRLDQATIDKFLAAVKRGKLPTTSSSSSV